MRSPMTRSRFNDFSRRRIVSRQQRQRRQIAEEIRQPQAADGDGHNDVRNRDIQRFREIRLNDPKQVQPAHQQQPDGQPHQLADVALQRPRKQQGKRHGEVEQYQDQADPSPPIAQALQIERDLVGQISRPDDQPLREAEISPDHDEGQHPLAMVVDEIRLQHFGHGLVVEENALDHHRETHGREDFTDEDDQAKDGRDPAGIERHDPVDSSERDRESVKDEPGTGYRFELLRVVGRTSTVGLLRPVREKEREYVPDRKINDGAKDETGGIQVAVEDELALGEMLVDVRILNRIGRRHPDRPRINTVLDNRNNDRNEQQRQ